MAERSDSIDHYSCETCGAAADLSRHDFFSDYEDAINQYLIEHEDLYYYSDDRSASYELAVPVSVSCSNEDCWDTITIKLLVRAEPEWEYDDPSSDHVPTPESFEIEVLEVLPPDTMPDTSMRGDYAIDLDDATYGDDYIDLDIGYDADAPNYKDLRIICKTKMNMNYCYMAYDEQGNRLLRPIFNTQRNECCWPRDAQTSFDVGSLVTFNVLRYPDDAGDHPTPYPHAYEDTVVERDARPVSSTYSPPWDFRSLEMIAKHRIYDIFPMELVKMDNNKFYVIENLPCPSAGIFLTEEKNMSVVNGRLNVLDGNSHFNFPITAIYFDRPVRNGSRKCLVTLGLGRPFSGTGCRNYNPARCYILVIGINIPRATS